MARIRSIKPEFFLHEGLSELSPIHRLLFVGLWTLADKRGRLEDRPKRIKAALFPWDDCDINTMLGDLERAGFLVRFRAPAPKSGEAKETIWIPTFEKNQKPHPKETEFDLPDPGPDVFGREISRQAVEENGKPEKGDDEQRGFFVSGNGPLVSGNGRGAPKAPPAAQKPGELRDGVEAEFLSQRGSAYEWSSQDENALRSKMQHGTPEILRRWRIALGTRYPKCSSVLDLVRKWNDYAKADDATGNGPPSREHTTGKGAAGVCESCGSTGDVAAFGGKRLCYPCGAALDTRDGTEAA